MVIDIDERFYIKPEAGMLLVSPADETPVAPCDVQPEEIDVALRRGALRGGHRPRGAPHRPPLGGPAQLRRRPRARWSVPIRDVPDFVWLAGQGGVGIMTAPALARIAAAQITGAPPPTWTSIRACLSVARLRR